jgi:ATP-GRASP peptide maturase of grasp-with-spasm system
MRYNGEDLSGSSEYCLELNTGGWDARLSADGRHARASEVRAVWYRRGGRLDLFSVEPAVEDREVSSQLDAHLKDELRETAGSLHAMLGHAPWLTRPTQRKVNKVAALQAAVRAGLQVPATIITNSRAELQAFQARHGRIITKSISDGTAFKIGDSKYTIYTEEVQPADVDQLPPTTLPTLAQELLEKAYELRIFYLAGTCYPMAIFSQRDARTSLDFRHYNPERPNRNVPYRLPADVAARVRSLMEAMQLSTGSLDMVRTRDGRLVFLEVNPVGQFGMVSAPCNYYLEKAVAQHLIALENDGSSKPAAV